MTKIGSHDASESQTEDEKCVQIKGWSKFVLHFSPVWFTVTMATGILPMVLHRIPFVDVTSNAAVLGASAAIAILNLCLFAICLSISAVRYYRFPWTWPLLLRHHNQPLLLAAPAIGFATLVSAGATIGLGHWLPGNSALINAIQAGFWIDTIASVAICFATLLIMIKMHHQTLDEVIPAWLFPNVAPMVTATSGAAVAISLCNNLRQERALEILLASYILMGLSLPLCLFVLIMYMQRLVMHDFPRGVLALSFLLPIGPLAEASYAFVEMGKAAEVVFAMNGFDPLLAAIFKGTGLFCGLLLWGFTLWWLFAALYNLAARAWRSELPFAVQYWGLIFPMGLLMLASATIGEQFRSIFFDVIACVFAAITILLWIFVAAKSVIAIYRGTLPGAPYLTPEILAKRGLAPLANGHIP